ncbi:MFS transporter [Streptomyces sp. ISL-99]|uniref:MFS transporter n=1 Tax=Streptomyces sp. ISL-99 TaxID=2819193 RepID=UPI001BEADF5B|nr:MFS transporter [Streptomyces sp. ISL-99]MBT2529964.1 MFS transporter [Streptomyces sp. ISL-99]
MPAQARSFSPFPAVSGDVLIVADRPTYAYEPRHRSRPRRPGRFSPYRRLFATPGARAFTAGNLLARLPMGMFSVSAVMMIAGSRGSYALAGAVTATGLAVTALVAPWTARLVDRHGQARVAVPATAVAVLGSLALLLCVRYGAPNWTLFAAYAATATTPNTGGMSRARWAHLHRGDPAAQHTANSFEQAADELCFMLGPVVAAFLCTALFPEAGTLTGAILLMTGVLIFAAQRATEPPVAPRTTTARSPLRLPGMPALLAVFLATGGVFGSMEVVTLAFADGLGHGAAAGPVLALQAAGSCVAGLLYGSARPAARPHRRLLVCVAAMTLLMSVPLLAASTGSLAAVAGALLLAGAATAPTMVTGMTLLQRVVPQAQLNEGMTLAVTAILGGIAAGAATGGWLAEHTHPASGYAAPVAAAAVALLLCLRTRPQATTKAPPS